MEYLLLYRKKTHLIGHGGLNELKLEVHNLVGEKIKKILSLRCDGHLEDYIKKHRGFGLSFDFLMDVIYGRDEIRSIDTLNRFCRWAHTDEKEKKDLYDAFIKEERLKNVERKKDKPENGKKSLSESIPKFPGIEKLSKKPIDEIFKNYQQKNLALILNEVMISKNITYEMLAEKMKKKYPYPKESIFLVLSGQRVPFPRAVSLLGKALEVEEYEDCLQYARNQDQIKMIKNKRL